MLYIPAGAGPENESLHRRDSARLSLPLVWSRLPAKDRCWSDFCAYRAALVPAAPGPGSCFGRTVALVETDCRLHPQRYRRGIGQSGVANKLFIFTQRKRSCALAFPLDLKNSWISPSGTLVACASRTMRSLQPIAQSHASTSTKRRNHLAPVTQGSSRGSSQTSRATFRRAECPRSRANASRRTTVTTATRPGAVMILANCSAKCTRSPSGPERRRST